MRKRLIIPMLIFGLSSVMSFANVLNDKTNHEETFVASTSEEDDAWIKIKDGKEEQAYRAFLAKYPNSQYAEQAASVVAMYDAEHYFDQGNYGEACEQFGKAMVYNELTADMKEKYEYALHAEKYKDIGSASLEDAHIYLQDYPQGMYATQASNRIAHLMADGFTKYSYNDALAYAKDFETYQYVTNASNTEARSIARNLGYYKEREDEREDALKWAQNKATKSYVEKEVSANERSRKNRYFWDDRLALGPELNFLDFASNTYGLDLGLSFRIGRYEDNDYDPTSPFTFICGVKYRFHTEYSVGKGIEYDTVEGHHVVGSCQFRLNYMEVGYGAWYLGLGGEYSHHFSGELNLGGAYIIGQFGYAIRNVDVGIYYKHRVYKEDKDGIFDDNFRIGVPLTFYF